MGVTTTAPRPLQHGPGYSWTLLWYLLLSLLFAGVMAFATLQPLKVLPRIGLSPGYALVDQDGQRLTSEDLRGKLVLYNFTYTACTQPCPQTGAAMQAIQAQLAEFETLGLPVQLVTIFFDPARDTPEALRLYSQQWKADPTQWRMVTGDPTHLKHVIGGGFGVYYEGSPNGSYMFDPTFALVDGAGILRARYRTAELDTKVVERDLGLIATEVARSQGPMRLAYEAAHLFMCYPR